jgi:hypothetical protein
MEAFAVWGEFDFESQLIASPLPIIMNSEGRTAARCCVLDAFICRHSGDFHGQLCGLSRTIDQ